LLDKLEIAFVTELWNEIKSLDDVEGRCIWKFPCDNSTVLENVLENLESCFCSILVVEVKKRLRERFFGKLS